MLHCYNFDNISWKDLVKLLKDDHTGSAVSSNIWQYTRVIFMETSLLAPLLLIIPIAWLFDSAQMSFWEMLLLMPSCLLILIAIVWPIAYFEYRRNRDIPQKMDAFVSAMSDVTITHVLFLNYYIVNYHNICFHIILDEPQQTKKAEKRRRTLQITMPYYDPLERHPNDLFFEIKEYLKGKIHVHLNFTEFALSFVFPYQPEPKTSQVKDAADMLLYILERFQLCNESPDEVAEERDDEDY